LHSGKSIKLAFQQLLPLREIYSLSLQQAQEWNGSLILHGISVIIVEEE
jgi:hypothetical protein